MHHRAAAANSEYQRFQGVRQVSPERFANRANTHPGTLYLEWAIAEHRNTPALALRRVAGAKTVVRKPDGAAIRKLVETWRSSLESPGVPVEEEKRQAHAVYDAVSIPRASGVQKPKRLKA